MEDDGETENFVRFKAFETPAPLSLIIIWSFFHTSVALSDCCTFRFMFCSYTMLILFCLT